MQFKDLTMSFGMQTVFENVNLNLPENEKIGIVGVNGAGKTTLFKLIMGLEYPDSGKIITKNGYRIDWLPQVLSDDVDNMDITEKVMYLDYLTETKDTKEKELENAIPFEEVLKREGLTIDDLQDKD